GRRGPDLTLAMLGYSDPDRELFRIVSEGIPGTEMESFAGPLQDDERRRLVAYLRSLAPGGTAASEGDRAAGEQLFWGKGGCGRCRRVGARGGSVGPNLTRAGRQRNLAFLRESIVDPDAEITPGYATITVVTREGKTITGVEKGFDNFSARLTDLSGQYYS